MNASKSKTPPTVVSGLVTFAIVAGCSLLFSSKGVFVKMAYSEGADTITVLTIRMAIALPFFVFIGWVSSRKLPRLSMKDWGKLMGLGFVGYYVSSYINFQGLRFISVGLERIVLFTYPSLILVGGALFMRRRLSRLSVTAVCIAYFGIIVSFFGEAHGTGSPSTTALGVGLVLLSALTYATFITLSADLVQRIGALRLASVVVGASCVFMLIHFGCVHEWRALLHQPGEVYGYGAILAVFGTVVPSLLMGIGLKRAGATNFAIIGTVGPVTTVILAWLFLGEAMNAHQVIGLVLSLLGGLAVSLWKST